MFCEDMEGCLRFAGEFPWSMFGLELSGCDSERCVRLNCGRSLCLSICVSLRFVGSENILFFGLFIWVFYMGVTKRTGTCNEAYIQY